MMEEEGMWMETVAEGGEVDLLKMPDVSRNDQSRADGSMEDRSTVAQE